MSIAGATDAIAAADEATAVYAATATAIAVATIHAAGASIKQGMRQVDTAFEMRPD